MSSVHDRMLPLHAHYTCIDDVVPVLGLLKSVKEQKTLIGEAHSHNKLPNSASVGPCRAAVPRCYAAQRYFEYSHNSYLQFLTHDSAVLSTKISVKNFILEA
jgi:hypothetical protein